MFLNEAKQEWKEESAKIDERMEAFLVLEREKLALEREKFEFKKLLLSQSKKGMFTECLLWHLASLF